METDTNYISFDKGQASQSYRAPSEGERSAIIGYSAQYRVAATLILRGLRSNRLEWIRVADPEAQRVDDLLVGSLGRVDAYQVKWSQYGGALTFLELVRERGDAPSLIGQLAQGWQKLRERYSNHRVVVHLVTNEYPSNSTQATLSVGDACPTPRHFAAFLAQAWEPAHQTPLGESLDVPVEWSGTWGKLRASSTLSSGEFEDFVRDCQLDFRHSSHQSLALMNSLDEQIASEDVAQIVHGLFEAIAAPERIIELTRDEMLRRLRWSERFDLVSQHHFPVDSVMYQPIESTVRELTKAIGGLPGGYIAVLGTPGSGKSTLLTKTLRSLPERLVTYYAYVPDSPQPMSIRGESVNFLHDIVVQLERLGITVGRSPNRFERLQLLERFHKQLDALHSDWMKSGRKTVFLIDGLDHIEREQHPVQSLLHDLPDPDQVPDGVYFVLGTQTDTPIRGRIQATVRHRDRKIEMGRLQRRQMYDMIDASNLQDKLTSDQQNAVYELSAGHPLALTYLLRQTQLSKDVESLIESLQRDGVFGDDIEAMYHTYWTQFSDDLELCTLLGRLARMRGAIDMSWVRTWAEDQPLQRLGSRFAHYFRTETSGLWYFFHNSFRLFLVERTSEFPAGTYEPKLNIEYHSELADLCAGSHNHAIQAWEELYHRFSAEQHEQVVEMSTQEFFRHQFFELRPIDAIHTDISIALRSATLCRDPMSIARLCLVGSEMRQREYYVEKMPLVSVLLGLGMNEVALEQLRSGDQLRVPVRTALEAAAMLLRFQGLEEESRRIFELAEPIELMSGSPPMVVGRSDEGIGLLESWGRLAALFRPVDEVINTIRRVEFNDSPPVGTFGSMHSVQSRLLLACGLELLAWGRWSDLSQIAKSFDSTRQVDVRTRFWLHFRIYKDRESVDDKARATQHLSEMLSVDATVLGPSELTALAEGVYRLQGDCELASVLIADVNQPKLRTDLITAPSGLEPFSQRFRLNRLMYVLGEGLSPSAVVLDTSDPRDRGLVLFERGLCTIAHIWAKGWLGQAIEPFEIKSETLPLLRLFCRPFEETQSWTSWLSIRNAKAEFCTLLVQAVAQHGSEALEALWQTIGQEWSQPTLARYWSSDERRSVIQAFLRNRFSLEWGREQLRELDDIEMYAMEPSERFGECMSHAKAWLKLDDHEQVNRFLGRALEGGYGVGYRKDYQMDEWIRWLGRVNAVEPESANQRITSFARTIEHLRDSTEGAATSSASERLLAIAFRQSPMAATQLLRWLLDKGLIGHQAGTQVILKEAAKKSPKSIDVALRFAREFVIPFSSEDRLSCLPMLVRRLVELRDSGKLIEECRGLAVKIRLYANPVLRTKWLSQLKQLIEAEGMSSEVVGLQEFKEEDHETIPSDRFSRDTLLLENGLGLLSRQDVEEAVSSVDDISHLLEAEADDSFFHWNSIITKLVHTVDNEDSLLALAELVRDRRDASEILATISTRLRELGDIGSAWKIGLQALDSSGEYGWNPAYDGGTRIMALSVLSNIDREKTEPLLYRTLMSDLQSNPVTVTSIAANLYPILPLLDEQYSLSQIWAAIEEHISPWLQRDSSPFDVDVPNATNMCDTPEEALVQLIAIHLDHPCPILAQASQRVLGSLLCSRSSVVAEVLKQILAEGESYQERVLVLLNAVALTDQRAISSFEGHVGRLTNSPNWLVRQMALSVGRACGWEVESPDSKLIPLPAIYQLSMPPQALYIPEDSLPTSPGEPMLDSEDPHRIVSPLNSQISVVSQAAGIPEEITLRRVVMVMHSLGERDSTWSANAEKKLQSYLRSVGIRLPFLRPRARLARRALFHVVAELCDAGRLTNGDESSLEIVLRTYDPEMVFAEPKPRPDPLQQMADLAYDVDAFAWVEGAEEALECTVWSPQEGTLVLAEETHFRSQRSWDAPIEERYSLIQTTANRGPEISSEPTEMFGATLKGLVSEYSSMDACSDESGIVMRNLDYGYDTPGADWLAFDPALARELGWSLSPNGFFRWVDSQGCIMVESIWWTDGLLPLRSVGHDKGAAGEGWYVIASTQAADSIQRKLGPLNRRSVVVRRIRKDGEEIDRRAERLYPI